MLSAAASAYALILLAEIGDKSQLVCMMLASRYRPLPVIIGSSLAFILLNLIAVTVGAALAQWIPRELLLAVVIALFVLFGFKAIMDSEEDEEAIVEKSGHSIVLTSFLMIFAAEFGDKTQLAVAGMAAAQPAVAVYIGATLALITTTCLGVFGGRWLSKKIPPSALHKLGGILFLAFAAWLATGFWS